MLTHHEIFKQTPGTINNITTDFIKSAEDQDQIDAAIDKETARRVSLVPGSEDLGVMTACWINGEFVSLSNYDLDDSMHHDLKANGDQ